MSSVVVLGEVLWDLFGDVQRLGGAPLNFGAHARRLGHPVTLISALGTDDLGEQAAALIAAMDLDTRLLQKTSRHATGTAQVGLGRTGATEFTIQRPASYDAVEVSAADLALLREVDPLWFYYGTLFAATRGGKRVLGQLLEVLPETVKFYDLNLRPGSDSLELVQELMLQADVVKLNEEELGRIQTFTGLPGNVESFCHTAMERYGWNAVAVTLGSRGCAMLAGGHYVEAAGHPVDVTDTVGAGDAFAAAFMHGLSQNWPVAEIASFANRVGAWVASQPGAIPDWTLSGYTEEVVKLA